MKTGHKIAILGGLTGVVGSVVRWRWMIRMPLKEFTRYALYMAVMDDEICRNELEGNQTGDEQMNRAKSRRQIQEKIMEMEQRLRESRQYIGLDQP